VVIFGAIHIGAIHIGAIHIGAIHIGARGFRIRVSHGVGYNASYICEARKINFLKIIKN
jgi:hypothetical protein